MVGGRDGPLHPDGRRQGAPPGDADAALGLPFDAPEDGSGSSLFQEAVDMFQDDPKE